VSLPPLSGPDSLAETAGLDTASASDRSSGEIVYGLNVRPPFPELIFAALQHLLAIFVPIITPGLIVCGAMNLDAATTAYIINMSLFASGICTLIQIHRLGPVGSGLLSIQGTSFSFVGPLITAGKTGGLSLIFGVCFVGSLVEITLSRFIRSARHILTPLVTGIVVTMIGMTLIKVGIINCAGGFAAKADGTFGTPQHLALAGGVLFLIYFLNQSTNHFLRMSSIFVGLAAGYLVAWFMGTISFAGMDQTAAIALPIPFKFGFSLSPGALISVSLIYLITMIETIGDLTATSMVSHEPIAGEIYFDRLSGGVLADGLNSMLAAILNTFPNTTFSQNNGIIQLTGIASRAVGYLTAAFLIILGLFPSIGIVFSVIPPAVLGGATLLLFGTIAANGIKIIAGTPLNRRGISILSVSLGLGLGVTFAPEILDSFPPLAKDIFGSGITTGGLTALFLNVITPGNRTDPGA
jgi:xanthine permease XanP